LRAFAGFSILPNSVQNVEVSDTTGGDGFDAVGYKKTPKNEIAHVFQWQICMVGFLQGEEQRPKTAFSTFGGTPFIEEPLRRDIGSMGAS